MASIGQYLGFIGMAVGGVVGFYLGGPSGAYVGVMIGGMLGGVAGAYFFPEGPKMTNVPPPVPGENRVQISTYGGMIPLVWGAKRIAGNIIWMSAITENFIRERHRVDGTRYYVNRREFTCSFAVAFCEGPVKAVKRIWVNNEVFVDFRDTGDPYYTATGDTPTNLDESEELFNQYYALYLGTEAQTADPTMVAALGATEVPGYRGICYVVFQNFPIGKFGRLPTVEAEVIRTTQAGVETDEMAEVVTEEIAGLAGIAAASMDLTDWAAMAVGGYAVTRQMPARTALEPLLQFCKSDVSELDWLLHFVPRGSSSVVSIDNDDLGVVRDDPDADADRLVETRYQDADLPTHLTMNYESRLRDYDTGSVNAVRIDKVHYLPMTISMAMVMTEVQAKQLAEILLKTLWGSRTRYRFATTGKYLYLAPSNIITVGGKNMRIIEMVDRRGLIEFTTESDEGGAYTSEAEADDISFVPPSLTANKIIPSVFFIDSAYFYDDDYALGFYVAFYGAAGEFNGGMLRVSRDDQYSWDTVAYADAASAVVGTMEEVFDGSNFDTDLTMSNQTLADTPAQIAAIGNESVGWEIIQFEGATQVSGTDHTFTVDTITRNINGSQFTHGTGEYFILLSGRVSIDKVFMNASEVGVSLPYQVASRTGYGAANSDGSPVIKNFTFSGTYTP
jgi:hypothetical protein